MEYFLSELGNTAHCFTSSFITTCIKDGQLEFDLVFAHPAIKSALAFSWLYKELFGIYPSKLDIPHAHSNFETHINHICRTTFLGLYKDLVKPDMQAGYNQYKNKLGEDKAFVKHQLFLLLSDRIQNTNVPVQYNPQLSLWKLFQAMLPPDIEDWYKCQEWTDGCPFTYLYPTDLQIPNSASVLTETDVYKHIIAKNFYFLMQLNSKRCIILSPAYSNYKCPFPTYVIRENLHLVHCIPKLCIECIIVGPTNVSLAPPNKTLQIPHFTGPEEAFSFYATTRIKEFLNIPRSINIPSQVLEIMFRKYKSIDIASLSTTSHTKATVLLLDNRDNIMSVIAAYITLSYLQPGKWSVTIITSPKQYNFYREYFPTANLLSHPFQEKTPFDIEDYNTMLKSPSLWKLLDNQQIKTALLIQDDGFIVRPGLEDKFLDDAYNCLYTYVGAPWQDSEMLTKAGATTMVGNGGLSLRDVPAMLEMTRAAPPNVVSALFNYNTQPLPEDVFFSAQACAHGRNAPKDIASLFASEMILNKDSFGVHKPWGYHPLAEIIKNYFKDW